jgi:hypothetical protein
VVKQDGRTTGATFQKLVLLLKPLKHGPNGRVLSDRSFGLALTIILVGLAVYRTTATSTNWWRLLFAALLVALATAIVPKALHPLNLVWSRIGWLGGAITTALAMGFIYFFIITPIGLTLRVIGKRPLRLVRGPAVTTYWVSEKSRCSEPDYFRDQF